MLVTGADQHQGLAVIRGLGLEGVPVVAASSEMHNIGFHSRFARETAVYRSPAVGVNAFIDDIVRIVARHRVGMIIPAIESTLVALDAFRGRIESICTLAAPESSVLEIAIDKLKTVALAGRTGVPVPRTLYPRTLQEALEGTRGFRFPVALKPRGNYLHAETRNRLGYKVKYAQTRAQLVALLESASAGGSLPLIQEYVRGSGVCVSALFDRGRPVAMFPYRRHREVPLTGGVSVVRESLALDPRLKEYVTRMLRAIEWHGIAMVEFKFDEAADHYVLMEINGRFQASTALSLDAGLNFPYLVYRLYAGKPLAAYPLNYRTGVTERWLRGDINALVQHLSGKTAREAVAEARWRLPSRRRALFAFLKDFGPAVHFDEFKRYDPLPGLIEAAGCARMPLDLAARAFKKAGREVARRGLHRRAPSASPKAQM